MSDIHIPHNLPSSPVSIGERLTFHFDQDVMMCCLDDFGCFDIPFPTGRRKAGTTCTITPKPGCDGRRITYCWGPIHAHCQPCTSVTEPYAPHVIHIGLLMDILSDGEEQEVMESLKSAAHHEKFCEYWPTAKKFLELLLEIKTPPLPGKVKDILHLFVRACEAAYKHACKKAEEG